jgi:hypothetical protein
VIDVIFRNPSGAPELACNECGCRWFDRMTNCCYECATAVPIEEITAYQNALLEFSKENPSLTPPQPPESK